ncbi:endoplasmic reticulum export factor secretory 16 isoform X2 [Leptinotarsa decemlineata]|uniref:endoplasmic reticulum export factor secretory 16 isoform X2 n=1 Tax=Leptinotarsa decemlineata TaxID=7539 RepID=UPI003D30A396
MAWMKKRGPSAPSPAPAPNVQMYNPNQHSNTKEHQWQNQQQHNWYQPQQTQYQPQQSQYQPVPNQQPTQTHQNYWQQPYNTQGYNQNVQQAYGQQYGNPQAGVFPNNTGFQQQNYGIPQYNQLGNQNNVYGNAVPQTGQQNEGDAWGDWAWGDEDNSNIQQNENATAQKQGSEIGNSFANDETWNWGIEEAKPVNPVQTRPVGDNASEIRDQFPKTSPLVKTENNSDSLHLDHVQDNSRLSAVRKKLDTPQWSTESQISQESSDDVVQTSESDKSHMMSRSSTISHSPISGNDLATTQNQEEVPMKGDTYENKEIVSNIKQELSPSVNPTPPPPKNTLTPPLMPPSRGSDDSKNPYKRTEGIGHKTSKFRGSAVMPPDTRQNVFQMGSFHSQQVNLETLPDNSEQPDSMPNLSFQRAKPVTNLPDNNEAPINDRNQYLETGQLSEGNLPDYNQEREDSVRQEVSDTLPPPGLSRMVPGQMEQSENLGNLGSFGDEPPPGLSRMVLGQTETVSSVQSVLTQNDDPKAPFDTSGPPEGLHRMIPGESSSPENSLRRLQQEQDDNDSEPEFNQLVQHAPQPRSATIGADTPPATVKPTVSPPLATSNRSQIIGGADNQIRNTATSTTEKSSSRSVKEPERRDYIDGQTDENEISNITNSVRNMAVGENLTDGQTSNTSLPDPVARKPSRQESSDSDREHRKPPRSSRDKRSSEKIKRDREREPDNNRERDRARYNDVPRDKKYDRRRYKDRRYEEDTDYYSDKERRHSDDRDREYERKYSSLRKEKDRDRRRRDPRDYRRGDYYYGSRYDYDYEHDSRSRPSSRSDSMHESVRERVQEKDHRDKRGREKEKERYRRHRDPRDMYNPYQGYSYDPYNPYYQQYQYYENLRRTNPQAYTEWYRKYYQQATGHGSSYGGEDRASVHSGRSSANDELAKDRYTRQSFYSQVSLPHHGSYYGDSHAHSVSGHYGHDISSYSRTFDNTDSSMHFDDSNLAAQRLTPAKFATAHLKASITSGKLIHILPHYPMDGQSAIVEVSSLHSLLLNNEEYVELSEFPGPLVKGSTHKKTIIEYCENKIKAAISNKAIVDVDSYVLMWDLLILLIRQNGMVVGTDIAELLLNNKREMPPLRRSSIISSVSSNNGDINPSSESGNHLISENTGSLMSILKEEEVTSKFREFLLYGSGKEALEWAMKHGLWGHALFLASKLDKRTYANVMMRFANGLTLNDPLQTLYQLLSGKMPAAVTCVCDEKWGDWRPHLAMILSNTTQPPELSIKAVTSLGDTLLNRGSLYAAQFCYLMAEVGFGKHGNPDTRLVLLGADHTKPYPIFASNEAIHMTEIYEYACGLNNPDFVIPQFQVYKYLLATRLADRGLLEKSLGYLESIAGCIEADPTSVQASFVENVCMLADKLKFYDPVGDIEDESEFGGIMETSRPDNSWLKKLRAIQGDFQTGLITHQSHQNLEEYQTPSQETDPNQTLYVSSNQDSWQQQYGQQYQQNETFQQQPWQPDQTQIPQAEFQHDNQATQLNEYSQPEYQDQQVFWQNQQQQWNDQIGQYGQETMNQQQSFYGSNAQSEETLQPQISLPNQPGGSNEDIEEKTADVPKEKPVAKVHSPAQEKTQSTGWFGGIFSRLALKPKNQMKLPDDKNPKIVWDQDKKRWMNVDEDPNDPVNEFKPPPKMSDIMPKMTPLAQSTPSIDSTSSFYPNGSPLYQNTPAVGNVTIQNQPSSLPNVLTSNSVDNSLNDDSGTPAPKSTQPNMFKLQRGRNLKNSYIDVFNPNSKPVGPVSLPVMEKLGPTVPQMNFFIPQPADPNAPVDFITPGGVPHMGETQMSRWSSTSSLSREVQFYMHQKVPPL